MDGRGLALLCHIALASVVHASDDPFEVSVISSAGRTVAADIADLNGDGRADLLQIVFIGIPPDERRIVRAYFQTEVNGLPSLPDLEIPLPEGSGAYDLADIRPTPGQELVLARFSDIVILNLHGSEPDRWIVPVPSPGTVWPEPDDRGLERVRLVWADLASEPLLLIPQLGSLAMLAADGTLRSQLSVGGRANYLVPAQPGLLFIESDIELFFDGPRLSIADVDGDGASDVVSGTRHEVRVFHRRSDGKFARDPDRVLPLRLMSERNHVRGSGGVSVQARDLNGDNRADLVVSHLTGGLTDARLEASLFINREGTWNLSQPDSKLGSEAALGSDLLLDVDGDGRAELLRASVPFSVLELIEALLTRSADARFYLYRFSNEGKFATDPWANVKVELTLSFDTFRPRGFLPAWHFDLNGDGSLDLLTSGGGEEVEVFLGGSEHAYAKRNARQKTDTEGLLRSGDLDGDGLVDLVVFNPISSNAPVRVFRNRGTLPGTAAGLRRPQPSAPPE